MEGACINIKLITWNRESGTGNCFLVSYLTKRLGCFKTVKIGNRESGTAKGKLVPYFGILDLCFKSANRE